MCWYPKLIGMRATKDGVIVPPCLVPCGRCIQCLQAKRAAWSFRLKNELIVAKSAHFLTLTYNDDTIPENYQLEKWQLQRYFKRVRSETPNIKYYAVGEYGDKNGRPHYHAIVFNSDPCVLSDKWKVAGKHLGITHCVTANDATIHYVTGYVLKKYGEMDDKTGVSVDTYGDKFVRPFAIMSKGLGISYVENAKDYHITNETFRAHDSGLLSRYLKLKIFQDYEAIRLEVSKEEQEKIKEELMKQSSKGVYTARQYAKALVKHSQKRKKL